MAPLPRRVAALGGVVCVLAPLAAVAGCSSLRSAVRQVGAGAHNAPAKTYTVTGNVTTLTVDTAGSITVTGTSGGPVTVTENASYSTTAPVTSHKVSGSALTLAYTCKPQLLCSVSYDIRVPRGTAVHAEAREDSITFTSLSGPVTAKTVTGLISGSGLTSPTATLTSGAGGIDVTFAAPPASVKASTDAGSININVPGSAIYQVSAHAVVGTTTVNVHHAASSPHVITAHSDLGGITIGST